MAIPALAAVGAAVGAGQTLADGGGFEDAIKNALGGATGGLLGGGGDQITQAITQGAIPIMGDMMMRMAGDMLNEAMSDE